MTHDQFEELRHGVIVLLRDCKYHNAWSGETGVLEKGTRIKGVTLVKHDAHTVCLDVLPYNGRSVYTISLFKEEIGEYFAKDTALNRLEKEYAELTEQYRNRRLLEPMDWLIIALCICNFIALFVFKNNAVSITGSTVILIGNIYLIGGLFGNKYQTLLDYKEAEINKRASSYSIDSYIERMSGYDA